MALIDLILRRVKEAPLLNNEVDDNFEKLGAGVDLASTNWYLPTEPQVTIPGMVWADTGSMLRKRRNDANTGWEVEGGLFDTPTNQNVLSLNGGQLAGMRNKIINGAFQINARVYVSGAATTAGQYPLDRWKVTGTGGVTFSTTNGKITVTIPVGQTLQQVIEGTNLPAGDYVLSWEGTAQGRVDGGVYGSSGSVQVSLAGGVNSTIEFNAGTVALVQFEPGATATPFEHRPIGIELALCQRYFCSLTTGDTLPVSANITGARGYAKFPVEMRVVPTIALTFSAGSGGTFTVGKHGMRQSGNHSDQAFFSVNADAEL